MSKTVGVIYNVSMMMRMRYLRYFFRAWVVRITYIVSVAMRM